MDKEFAYIVDASSTRGLTAQLKDYNLTEDIATNSLIVVEGAKRKYLGLVAEIFHSSGSDKASELAKQLAKEGESKKIAETTIKTYSNLGKFSTSFLIIPLAQTNQSSVEEVDTIPVHESRIYLPKEEDIENFYGKMDNKTSWGIGYTKHAIKELDLKVKIPINVELITRGSFGIFGKSGTGKTHLGNILASLIILTNRFHDQDKKTKLLIFDMHSEYGLKVKDMHGNDYADGVGLLFKNDFKVYTPDSILAREFGLEEFTIDPKELTMEDIEILKENLNLSDAFIDYLGSYRRIINQIFEKDSVLRDEIYKKDHTWILYLLGFFENREDFEKRKAYLEGKIEEEIQKLGAGAVQSFRSGKVRLNQLRRYEFLNPNKKDCVKEIVEELFKGERSIIISFGRYGDDARVYTLIAHLLSKKIWQRAISDIMEGKQLKYKLIIFLEEAHKFLSGELYYKTAFGNIARELRKRGIVLCIIDQRPSQIHEDVLAMLWNYFIFTLTSEKDIEACTRGLKFQNLFIPVISNLKRKEALVYGEAIRLPAILNIIDYKEFTKEIKDYYEKSLLKLDIPGY
ncbi:MAG: ATP-binding protein [Thermoproteota archaeon]|jgi:DNA helicase HerA-like ATPase|nr:ATP-binding protein [Thermoproteota archaeon]